MSDHAAPSLPADPPRRLRTGLAVLIFLITAAAFARSAWGGFIDFDDFAILFKVDGYRGLALHNLAWDFSVFQMGHFQPLTWISYGIEFLIWGLDPKTGAPGFHLTNVLLHAANAVLVYFLAIRLMTAAGWPAANDTLNTPRSVLLGAGAAALFFSLNPLRVESVAWITERRDVLSTFFLVLAALSYLRAFTPGSVKASSPGAYWLVVGLLLLSLLSKSWGMSFFVIVTILDIYPLRRLPADPRRWRNARSRAVLVQKLPLAVLGIAALIIAGLAQSSLPGTTKSLEEWSVGERLVQSVFGLYFYVVKTFVPINLCALYDFPVKLDPLEPRFVIAYAAVLGGAVILWMSRRQAPALLAAGVCYAVTVAPVLGFFQSGIQFVADRYSYVSCIGWAVLVGAGVAWLLRERATRARTRVLVGAGALVVCGVFAVGTWRQTYYWKDALYLWQHALEVGWDGPTVRQYLAYQLNTHQDIEGAEAQYRISIEMNPNQGGALYPYGNILRDRGDYAGAEQAYIRAAGCMADPWRACTALGLLYLNHLDRPDDAVNVLRAGIRDIEKPGRKGPAAGGQPYFLLAGALYELGDLKGCRDNLRIAAKEDDTREQAQRRLAEVEAELRGAK